MGSVSYTHLQLNAREDGSSRFHKDHRWGFFPSASVGWVISNEKFMQNITPINYLKFRASIGTLGNERIGNYPYQTYISFNNAIIDVYKRQVRGCFISYQRIASRDLFFLKIILQQFCQFFYLLHIGAGLSLIHISTKP